MASKHYTFVAYDKESQFQLAEQIHNSLKGNQDYVDCRIVLHINDNTENEPPVYGVALYVDSGVEVPEIKIQL